jgi:hypothetical protein
MIQVRPRESEKSPCSDAPDESIPAPGRGQKLPAAQQQKPEEHLARSAPLQTVRDALKSFAVRLQLAG